MRQTQDRAVSIARDHVNPEVVSAWCGAVLQGGLDGPIGEPHGWAEAVARAIGDSAAGLRAALVIESACADLTAKGVSFSDDEFIAHQWTRSLLHGEPASRRESTLGLAGLASVRVGVRIPQAESDGVLTIEIGSNRSDWEAPAPVAQGLPIAASMLAKVYERLVVRPVLRRQNLMMRLRPTQQALIPFLVEGLSEAEIAGKIGRSKHTVHDHTKKIYKVLGVRSRIELAAKWNGTGSAACDGNGRFAAAG
jgi:DNA-binding CsgD family transcriptional regulator